LDVLPAALGASQTFEEHQSAGTVQPGDQAADAGGADLSRRGELSAIGARRRREQHEEWMEGSRYLNANLLREQIKPMKTTMAIAA
jgi:hypothetical protein